MILWHEMLWPACKEMTKGFLYTSLSQPLDPLNLILL